MDIKNIVLPLVTLIGGVLALYTDGKNRLGRYLLLAFLLLSAGVTLAVNGQETKVQTKEKAQDDKRINGLIEIDAAIQKNTSDIAAVLRRNGFDEADASRVGRSLQASTSRSAILPAAMNGPQLRVEYFPKDVDGPRVFAALKEANFQVTTPASALKEATNAVWVGRNVTLAQAKFVALTLMQAGVTLRGIFRFAQDGGGKADLVQIGRAPEPDITDRPPLTVAYVNSMNMIPLDPHPGIRRNTGAKF